MKKRIRTCNVCFTVEETFSKSPVCAKCVLELKKKDLIVSEQAEISDLGYKIVGGPFYDDHNHRKYKVITPCCGVEYEPLILTIRSMLDRRGILPCSACGGKARMAIAKAAYLEKHARDYNLEALQDYVLKVRSLSEKTYMRWRAVINPSNLTRGHAEYHLDHIVPVMWCFKNNVPPVLAANVLNLQILKYNDNLKKLDKTPDNPWQVLGYDVVNVLDYNDPILEHGKLNIWPHDINIQAINSMIHYRRGLAQKLNARSMQVRIVPQIIAAEFLNNNHLNGSVPSNRTYGLFDGDTLIMVLSLGKPRFSKKYDIEVLRMATAPNIVVRGGASKLFSYARKEHPGKKVVCYSDLYVGTGNVYAAVGFTADGNTGSGYFWEKDGQILQRYQTQKHKLSRLLSQFDPKVSEVKNMKANGWRQVITAGNTRWIAEW
jgi:hypothetical protein